MKITHSKLTHHQSPVGTACAETVDLISDINKSLKWLPYLDQILPVRKMKLILVNCIQILNRNKYLFYTLSGPLASLTKPYRTINRYFGFVL